MSVLLLQFFAFPPSSPKTGLFNIFIIVSLLLYLPICCLDFRAAGPEYFNSLRADFGKEVSIVISSDYRTCSYFFESFSKPNSSSTPSVTDSKHSLYVPSHLKHGPASSCQLFTWEFLPRSSRIHSCNLTSTLGGLLPSLPSSLLPFLLPSSISLTLLLNPPPSLPLGRLDANLWSDLSDCQRRRFLQVQSKKNDKGFVLSASVPRSDGMISFNIYRKKHFPYKKKESAYLSHSAIPARWDYIALAFSRIYLSFFFISVLWPSSQVSSKHSIA